MKHESIQTTRTNYNCKMCKNVCVDDDAAVVGATHVITINKTKMNKQTVAFIYLFHSSEGGKKG